MASREPTAQERDYMDMVAAVVRGLRAQAGQGVRETADALGMSLSSYKRLERAQYLPSGADLQRMGRHWGLDANLLVFGFTLIGDETLGAGVVRRWQRLVYRLRALDLQTQTALGELVADLYQLHLERGGISAERAARLAQRRLQQVLAQMAAEAGG